MGHCHGGPHQQRLDRGNFEKEYNSAIAWQDFRRTRLIPVFENLMRGKEDAGQVGRYRYGLQELSPQSIYPQPHDKATPATDEKARVEYKALFDAFVFALENLKHRELNLELWLEHLDSLLLIHTAMIPAARAGKVVPDVSLYDHSRGVAALATALYVYHKGRGDLTAEAVCDDGPNKFLLISGDFYGIQDFIFSDSGEEGKNRAKILRGRSFAVSLYCELAADMLCRAIGLPATSCILNAAGKFTLIAPNSDQVKEAVKQVEARINHWLLGIAFGQSAMGITYVEASPADFTNQRFVGLWERLNEAMAERKYRKFPIDTFGGAVDGYLDAFRNDLTPPLCPYCGKRPATVQAEAFRKNDDKSMCSMCRDHIFLGDNVVKSSTIAIAAADAGIEGKDSKLLVPIFDTYQVAFIGGNLSEMAKTGKLFKFWDISIDATGKLARDATARFLAGYCPKFTDEDRYDDRILMGRRSDSKKEDLIDKIDVGSMKTFEHLAAQAMNMVPKEGGVDYRGIQALGILKADVDQLGLLMTCGIPEKDFTLSRLATLSRQLHFFFAVYLPHLLKTDARFKDIYTVFAGGDDLFLVGPWNRMVELALWLHDRFSEYTCKNEEIHFSAGISLQKANTPLAKLAEDAEEALGQSKGAGRNRITLFGQTATWEEFQRLRHIKDRLADWAERGLVNSAMIYRLNAFIDLVALEKEVLGEGDIHIQDMESLKWRAYFKYTTERNIGRQWKDEGEKRKAKEEFAVAASWLEDYGARLRIACGWIYNNR